MEKKKRYLLVSRAAVNIHLDIVSPWKPWDKVLSQLEDTEVPQWHHHYLVPVLNSLRQQQCGGAAAIPILSSHIIFYPDFLLFLRILSPSVFFLISLVSEPSANRQTRTSSWEQWLKWSDVTRSLLGLTVCAMFVSCQKWRCKKEVEQWMEWFSTWL